MNGQAETERLEIIRDPTPGNPGTAGLGIRHRPNARKGERVTIEQLWPDGKAEPVYVDGDDLGELIHELMGVHIDVMEASTR